MKRRISAALLTLCLLMSLMPTVAFAAPSGSFDDVDGHWGQAAVERWAGYGVVNGDGTGNFNPDNQMTRAEFATMLANMLGYKEKATNTFSDVNDSDWFADAILKLAAAGVIQGSNGMANPNAPISRQEAAVMMCRAFNIPTTGGSLDFADSADVADWAKGAVAALASRGMMNGVGGNNVAPLANINRASVATLLDNMITEYVTEDKTVSGEVKGIVLVAGNATVTFEDATLAENLIVAPKAEGAEVVLTGSTTAGDVYVDGTATVKVDSSATAGDVQVGAANSTVEVAGKADTVTVDSAAADTKVNVGKDATVGTVDVAGANTAVTVDGKVDNVNVSSSATGTDVVANSGATVGKVETAAKDVTVSGNGKVENVTATDGTVAVTTPNTNVTNKTDSADNVTNQGKPVPPENGGGTPTPTPPSGGSNGGGTTTPAKKYNVKVEVASGKGTVTPSTTATDEAGTITLTVAPQAQTASEMPYVLESLTVTAPGGEPQDIKSAMSFTIEDEAEAGTYTVTAKFYQPITKAAVLHVDGANTKIADMNEYGYPENPAGAPVDDAKLAETAGGYLFVGAVKANDALKADALDNLVVKFNGDTKTVTWGGAVKNWGCVYINGAVADDPNAGTPINFTEDFATIEVTFQFKGASYTLTTDYAKKGADATKKVTVALKGANGADLGTMVTSKGQAITLPTPASNDSVYYTGVWKNGSDKITVADGKYTIPNDAAANMTLTAESVPVIKTTLSVRENGPEGDVNDFNYQAAYTAAGLSLNPSTGEITVDAAKFINWVNDEDNTETLEHIKGPADSTKNQVMFGIAYGTPTDATKVAFAANLESLASASEYRVLAEHPSCYNNTLISYIPVATIDPATNVVTFATTGDSDYCKWVDADNNVVAVTKTVITIGAPTNMPEMTITVDGNTGSVKVPYNTAITQEQYDAIAKLAVKEGSVLSELKDGETKVVVGHKFTKDTQLTATWAKASTVKIEPITTEQIYNAAVNLADKPAFSKVDLTITPDSTDSTLWKATGKLEYVTGFTGFNNSVAAEQEGYYVLVGLLFDTNANNTIRQTSDVVFTYGSKEFKGTDYANIGLSDGKIQVATLMHYNPAPGADENITFTVDWDGKGTEYAPTTYTIDLSGVTFVEKENTNS